MLRPSVLRPAALAAVEPTAPVPSARADRAPAPAPAGTWAGALDEFAAELARAEELLGMGLASFDSPVLPPVPRRAWSPPTGLGPLPPEMADYARSLHARQLAMVTRLSSALSANRRSARAADSIEATDGPVRPLFVDASG